MDLPGHQYNERVLSLESASVALPLKAIREAGIETETCSSVSEIVQKAPSAGAALLIEESLTDAEWEELRRLRRAEPQWSDFPILVLVNRDENRALDYLKELGNVCVLERPVHSENLISALTSELWSRRHQFEMCEVLASQRRTVTELDGLAEIGGHFLTDDNPEDLATFVCERICEPLGIEVCIFRQFDTESGKFRIRAFSGITETQARQIGRIYWVEGVVRRIAAEPRPTVFENVRSSSDPQLAVLRAIGVDAWVCHPLVSGVSLIGFFCFGTRTRPRFDHDELAVMHSVCSQLAVAIARKQAERELHHLNLELNRRVEERTAEFRDTLDQLEAFSYSVAHDLRAPLRTIRGFSQALLEDYGRDLDPVGKDFLRRIDSGGARMDVLIRDLLEYSRMGHSEMTIECVDLDEVIDTVVAQFSGGDSDGRPQFQIVKPFGVVQGHTATVRQVVFNLVANAVKFVRPDTPPRIVIRSQQREGNIRLWIEDNGIGIAPEHLQRIFGVFERLHTSDSYPGTGIGLAIVAKGIRRMGGTMGVDSVEGQGSRFWIELPEA